MGLPGGPDLSLPRLLEHYILLPAPKVTKLVGEFLYGQFKTIFEEALLLAAALDELSQTHLDGKDLLFVDTHSELVRHISQLRATAQLYAPLAAWLKVKPMEVHDFPPGHARVGAKAVEMADFSKAAALTVSGDGRQFKGALHQFCPEPAGSS